MRIRYVSSACSRTAVSSRAVFRPIRAELGRVFAGDLVRELGRAFAGDREFAVVLVVGDVAALVRVRRAGAQVSCWVVRPAAPAVARAGPLGMGSQEQRLGSLR